MFVGGSFVDWLILNKTEFIPLDGSYNEVINAVKSSVNPNPHTVKAGTGTSSDRPLIALTEWGDGKHLYQESSGGTLQHGAGTYAERPYYIFVRSSTATETVNPAPEYKTLTFEYKPNDLIFTFREDEESPYSWQEAYDEAIANGKRMPTKTELLNYLASQGNQPLYQEDIWIYVYSETGLNSKIDMIQVGISTLSVGTSLHTVSPTHGALSNTGATASYSRFYCEVIDQTEYTVNFPEETTCDILIVGGGGGGGFDNGGGGGAGACIVYKDYSMNGTYTINVGKGGNYVPSNTGLNGSDSSINSNLTEIFLAKGGGGGAKLFGAGLQGGSSGGCGAAITTVSPPNPIATNKVLGITTGPILTATNYVVLGNKGGNSVPWQNIYNQINAGGGGGMGEAGIDATINNCGGGGDGVYTVTINGTLYNLKNHFSPNSSFGVQDGVTTNYYIGGGGGGGGKQVSGSIDILGGKGGGGGQ